MEEVKQCEHVPVEKKLPASYRGFAASYKVCEKCGKYLGGVTTKHPMPYSEIMPQSIIKNSKQ
jgi:ribosomal protein L34E